MPIDPALQGRSYGPFQYQVSLEKIREFALAVGGGVPSAGFSADGTPPGVNPLYVDPEFARTTRHGSVIAPPTFCVIFNIRPFAAAVRDPLNHIDLLMLVHGEQTYEFLEPVRPGDVLTSTGTVTQAFSKAGKDFVTVVCESVNQDGRTAVRGTYTAVIRPPAA